MARAALLPEDGQCQGGSRDTAQGISWTSEICSCFSNDVGKATSFSLFLTCLAQLICPSWDRHILDKAKHKGAGHCLNL